MRRQFSTINLAAVNRAQVLESKDPQWIGSYMRQISLQNAGSEHHEHLEELFRQNFRKMEFAQAMEICSALNKQEGDNHHRPTGFEDSFWVWETLENALTGKVDQMSSEQLSVVCQTFAANWKGSEEFNNELMCGVCAVTAPSPFPGK